MLEKVNIKKIPCGISDFEVLRRGNNYYIDKTKYIEDIEASPRYLFFLRPRRFGKSLWTSVMENYYDIAKKDKFEELFKGTYIYDNPTEERNKYLILKFTFSDVSPDINKVETSFNETIKIAGLEFIKKYETYLATDEKMYNTIEAQENASEILKYLISFTKNKGKMYLLIDEYDNFTNTIISSTGHERYIAITHGEGFYRHFFNVIKAGTGSGTISKIFITGVSPVTMDDITSGFNIGTNITTGRTFNEMAGFSEREVMEMLDYYGINPEIIDVMRPCYNNYLFSKDEETRMYNSDMALYFINEYIISNKLPEEMLSYNIRTDYDKLKYLIMVDYEGRFRVNGNFEKLKLILEEGEIRSNIVRSFSVNRVVDTENFISLLYYLGLLTIKGVYHTRPILAIPNEVIKRLYYEYIRQGYRDTNIFNIELFKLENLFDGAAYEGKMKDLIDYLSGELNNQTAVRDYIEGERVIQNFFCVYFNVSNYYITRSEYELNKGYADIVLIPNLNQFRDIKYTYLIEMKYITVNDYKETELNRKIKDAEEKLEKYRGDDGLKKLAGNTEIVRLIMVFSGSELKYFDVKK